MFLTLILALGMLQATLVATMSTSAHAAVGQGFNLNPSDLRFILRQIKISEEHVRTRTPANPCGTLLGAGPNQIPNQNGQGVLLPWGLRTVDGSCNNLTPGRARLGAADNTFPRVTNPSFRSAETGDPDGPGPAPSGPSSYTQKSGTVIDSQPRLASNLIVDQTTTNPAAVEAAGEGATPDASGTLFIKNTAPDVGLSAPYNSMFTLFGQFFDHGLDLTKKSGGTVFTPLAQEDPLFDDGADNVPGNADDGPNFMVLTRSTNQPGPDGAMGTPDDVQDASNQTSPFVDQSQTYTSHPSHQVFLREYALSAAGRPVSTGKMLTGADGGLGTWMSTKAQASSLLGIQLTDIDVLNIPVLRADPYGRFIPGTNGFPQMVTGVGADGILQTTDDVVVEGDPAANGGTGVLVPANALRTGHAFLDDIAHHAAPFGDHDGNPATARRALSPDDNSSTADDTDPATYDNEMLDAHFVAGDGRINENIGLSAVHQIFHSEHNRLVGAADAVVGGTDIKSVIANQDPTQLSQWKLPDGSWNGEYLFQAARFTTEMQYQHLAFEEFARKVQPMINVFSGYDTSVDPAVSAEFAHSVYRFGHSMLNETVSRTSRTGANRDIPLLDAFLNPPSYTAGGLTPEQAAGDIVRGMADQYGNELDEFVTEALRNRLLGLPLDLATLNLARGRDTGIPSMNGFRRQVSAATNQSALAPYANWIDFGLEIKHPESLVNFVAAYGRHDTIVNATTMAAKRTAAARLLANDPLDLDTPADSAEFMNGTGAWANANGRTTTGLDDVDLWVGGLAEKQAPFGGLLGTSFNYIFETQMENLQDGDRFYYLTRTAGLNMLVQLEGNSFSELITRNTDAVNLPADVFSRPDLRFDLSVQGKTPGSPIVDDPATVDYDERAVLSRMSDGTVRYSSDLHVVFNGSADVSEDDWARSSEGDDTLRGNDGDDRFEGGAGNDGFIGGLGDDILTDAFGDDVLKGGDGDDAMSSGPGFDLNQGGRGNDFVVGGSDPTETFGGPGDDIVFGGDSADTVFGDDGDDWIEGGGQSDLLQGDNGAPFQDDPNTPGHDVINGNGGADDYDAEGGDDVMVAGAGVERNEGMLGFDWVTNKLNPQAANDDLQITGLLPPSVDALRDRFDLVEALSGWNLDDTLRGDSFDAATTEPGNALDAAGIARINGLAAVLPGAATSFTGGNIMLGGAGSDLLEGRGGDDVIDGDKWLNVQLRAPDTSTTVTGDFRLVNSMTALQADVVAGRIKPGDISVVRTIETAPNGSDVDTAVFTQVQANYDITVNGDGTTTVAHVRGNTQDGVDTLSGIEVMQFGDTGGAVVPTAPVIGTAVAGNAQATVNWTPSANDGGSPILEQEVDVITGGVVVSTVLDIAPAASNVVVPGLTNGTAYTFRVRAINAIGDSLDSAASNSVTPTEPNVAPTVTARTPAVNATGVAVFTNITSTFSEAVTGISGTTFTLRQGTAANGPLVAAAVTATATGATLNPNANLQPNTLYTARLLTGITDTAGAALVPVTWSFTTADTNAAPTVTARTPAVNATGVAVFTNITSTFSEAVTGISGTTFTLRQGTAANGPLVAAAVTATATGATLNPNANLQPNTLYTARLLTGITDTAGAALVPVTWSFTTAGTATAPGAPAIGTAASGVAGGTITATANWAAPTTTGGSAITGYRVFALRMSAAGAVLQTTQSAVLASTARTLVMALPQTGNYRFQVVAINAAGTSTRSARSNLVAGR